MKEVNVVKVRSGKAAGPFNLPRVRGVRMDSKVQVKDVNEEIQRLKTEGKSLRGIATTLGISHVAVLKR